MKIQKIKFNTRFVILVVGVVLSLAGNVYAATWYVNPSGAIGNGSQAHPWGGFSHIAWGSIHQGDTLTGSNQIFTEQLMVGVVATGLGQTIIKDMVIDGSTTNGIYADQKDYITYQNITTRNNTGRGIFHRRSDHVHIEDCTITDNGNNQIQLAQADDNDHNPVDRYDWSITDSTISSAKFVSGTRRDAILLNFNTAKISGVTITGNTITGGYNGVRFLPNSDKVVFNGAGVTSDSIVISNNTFDNVGHNAVTVHKIRGANGASEINNNVITNSGSFDAGIIRLNALQIHYCYDLMVEGNYIEVIHTNSPDGAGIMLDWDPEDGNAVGVVANRSKRVTVRNNFIANAHKGISSFMAQDCLIYGNILVDNCHGMKNASATSTGNQYFNNTFVHNGYCPDYDAAGVTTESSARGVALLSNHTLPEDGSNSHGAVVEFRNNIFVDNLKVYHVRDSDNPNEANNIFHNNVNASDVTHNSPVNVNPLLTSGMSTGSLDHDLNYKIAHNSPAIAIGWDVGLGGKIDKWGDIIQTPPNIGADAWFNHPPTNITLSNNTIDENQATNTVVGTLSSTDADAGDTHTYSLSCTTPGADDSSFNINNNELRSSSSFDYETKNSYAICIKTDDGHGGTFAKNFTITINKVIRADVDQSSTINSTDAMLTLRNSSGLDMSSTNWQTTITTGDVNCDGNSNSDDVMLILRHSLGFDMSGTGWCVD